MIQQTMCGMDYFLLLQCLSWHAHTTRIATHNGGGPVKTMTLHCTPRGPSVRMHSQTQQPWRWALLYFVLFLLFVHLSGFIFVSWIISAWRRMHLEYWWAWRGIVARLMNYVILLSELFVFTMPLCDWFGVSVSDFPWLHFNYIIGFIKELISS